MLDDADEVPEPVTPQKNRKVRGLGCDKGLGVCPSGRAVMEIPSARDRAYCFHVDAVQRAINLAGQR